MEKEKLESQPIEQNLLEIRYRIRRLLIEQLDNWTLELEKKKIPGAEIMKNLVRYCHLYMSRCTDMSDIQHYMPMVKNFIDEIDKKYPWGTNERIRLVEQLIFGAYYLLDPELQQVTEAGKNLEKT